MTRFLRLFESFRKLEREHDLARFEVQYLKARMEELDRKLQQKVDDYERDLRKIADSESRRNSGRNIFAEAAIPTEQFGRAVPRHAATGRVQMTHLMRLANKQFREDVFGDATTDH